MSAATGRAVTRKDPVTPDLRLKVLERDEGCVGWMLGAPDPCEGPIELDHVKDQPMMGRRAPSDERHLASICRKHHQEGWATSHRPLLRRYLEAVQTLPAARAALVAHGIERGNSE